MRLRRSFALLIAVFGLTATAPAKKKNDVDIVRKAVKRSTLNQPGTKPYHLKAEFTPSRESDRGSNRTGTVEIWWISPTQFRQEVRSPDFHQIAIVNDGHEWQKNEGDYFPEWLRELAVALIEPVPSLDKVLEKVEEADVKKLMGQTNFSWTAMSTDGSAKMEMGEGLAIKDKTGLLFYGSGMGWSGLYQKYKRFHGLMVARTVSLGSPEVTAKVSVLEDLRVIPYGLLNAEASGGDASLLRTVVVEESAVRKNLLPMDPPVWPPLKDGPLDGAVTTEVVLDRTGIVRDVGSIVSNNSGVNEVARRTIAAMRFKPYLQNEIAVQVLARITMGFKTTRPEGVESFESAQTYFERGRHVCFPAAGSGPPYVLKAVFKAKVKAGTAEDGQYTDSWISDQEWRREASIGKSRYVRARHGEKRYQLAEGPDAPLLKFVLKAVEPIPAIDTFTESDWKIKRDTVDGLKTIRVLAGYESPDGTLDPKNARAYWFDEAGKLLKTYSFGVETRPSAFEKFGGAEVAHQVMLLRNGALVMFIRVTQLSPAGTVPPKTFELRGHEWTRAFTDEVR